MINTRTTATAWSGLLLGIAASALVLATIAPWASVTGALLIAAVPPGAAVMCWVDSGDAAAQAGLTLVISLTVLALTSAIMIWAHAWEPDVLVGVTAASVISCLIRLRRKGSR